MRWFTGLLIMTRFREHELKYDTWVFNNETAIIKGYSDLWLLSPEAKRTAHPSSEIRCKAVIYPICREQRCHRTAETTN